jgi:hypothetical protein
MNAANSLEISFADVTFSSSSWPIMTHQENGERCQKNPIGARRKDDQKNGSLPIRFVERSFASAASRFMSFG